MEAKINRKWLHERSNEPGVQVSGYDSTGDTWYGTYGSELLLVRYMVTCLVTGCSATTLMKT